MGPGALASPLFLLGQGLFCAQGWVVPQAPVPILSIAGSDCSAGAGIQADLKTISALGGYGLTALTSVVAETPGKVSSWVALEPAMVSDQIRVLLQGFAVGAAKTGMVGGRPQIQAAAQAWREWGAARPLVVDPVMVATSGGRLLRDDAVGALEAELIAQATVVTPNMDEAAVFWGREVRTRGEMLDCARALAQRWAVAVLLKGGHLRDDLAEDVLVHSGGEEWLSAPRTAGVHTHGTGCCFSAALATGLGQGMALVDAARRAKVFVSQAIAQHFSWGQSPQRVDALNHFHVAS